MTAAGCEGAVAPSSKASSGLSRARRREGVALRERPDMKQWGTTQATPVAL